MNKFNRIWNRSTANERKWDLEYLIHENPQINKNKIINSSIADLDFATPKPIVDAILARARKSSFSYGFIREETLNAIKEWYQEYHHLDLKDKKIKIVHGTVNAMFQIAQALTEPQDGILIQTPIYAPFGRAINNTNRTVIKNELIWNEKNNTWTINFTDFIDKIKKHHIKLFMFCNPHNPGSLAWKKSDVDRIINICKEYNVTIFSDEVHSDLKWNMFTSCLEYQYDKIIVANSPNKAFNLGGIKSSYLIFNNELLWEKINQQYENQSITSPNVFAQPSLIAAFTNNDCKEWLISLLLHVQKNFSYIKQSLDSRINIMESNSSYLVCLDYHKINVSSEQLTSELIKANLLVNENDSFYGSENFKILRINIGTSLHVVKETTLRLNNIFKKY